MPWWLTTIILILGVPTLLLVLVFLYAAFMQTKYFKDDESKFDNKNKDERTNKK